MVNLPGNALPVIFINGTDSKKIVTGCDGSTIDFHIDQSWNESINSYNVIGQINGTNTNETIIIECLYDCWWNQGTADSAIGMSIVLAIAKYFKDNNITPKCNIKFIAFGGEEQGFLGAEYYEATHRNENITAVIDFNQLGFNRTTQPKQSLYLFTNNQTLNTTLSAIVADTNYEARMNYNTYLNNTYFPKGAPSDDRPFAIATLDGNRSTKTVSFLKDALWPLHHRDGMDHTEGDVLKYYNETDVNLTAEMAWNVTKYFTVDPDCWFSNVTY